MCIRASLAEADHYPIIARIPDLESLNEGISPFHREFGSAFYCKCTFSYMWCISYVGQMQKEKKYRTRGGFDAVIFAELS